MATTDKVITPIDFIPTANEAAVAYQVGTWLREQPVALTNASINKVEKLKEAHDFTTLYLDLGGYVTDPTDATNQVNIEASFTVDLPHHSGVHEDPEGTHWVFSTPEAKVSWPSYGSSGAAVARLRADMIDEAVKLAEGFDERFRDTKVWMHVSTRAEREEQKRQHDIRQVQHAVEIVTKAAIHSTCRNMRVGSVRTTQGLPTLVPGDYVVETENKAYDVHVAGSRNLRLTRMK